MSHASLARASMIIVLSTSSWPAFSFKIEVAQDNVDAKLKDRTQNPLNLSVNFQSINHISESSGSIYINPAQGYYDELKGSGWKAQEARTLKMISCRRLSLSELQSNSRLFDVFPE